MKDIVCPRKTEIDELMFLKGTILRINLNNIGLYVGQPVMLDIITNNPGLTQKVLADIANIKPSTVNVMLGRMAKNGLVEIKKDENNSKLSRVYITETGKKLFKKCDKFKQQLDEFMFEGLSTEEIQNFNSALLKINNNLRRKLKEEEK